MRLVAVGRHYIGAVLLIWRWRVWEQIGVEAARVRPETWRLFVARLVGVTDGLTCANTDDRGRTRVESTLRVLEGQRGR